MKNHISIKSIMWAACAVTALSACSDWTETESLNLVENGIAQQQGEAYAKYLANLRDYKAQDHKVVYGWFDNSEKTPFTRGQHLSDVPDSIDVVIAGTPELTELEVAEVAELHQKGTQVFFSLSYDRIKKAYEEAVKEAGETRDFATVLSEEVNKVMAHQAPFDGLVVEYKGSSPVYMTTAEKAETAAHQATILSAVQSWKSANGDKKLAFYGYPAHLLDLASILPDCRHIILVTDKVGDVQQYGIEAMQALISDKVPADRFVISVSTVSLDTTDKITGFLGDARATTEAAYWLTTPTTGITKAGLAILDIQNDYYNATNTYQYVREAIQIMNPAPAK